MDNKGFAAIWSRVSTQGQKETSLPSQIARCREKLQSEGYMPLPEYTFSVDWASLELSNCPEYIQLLSIIMSGKVQAIAVYDRDRLPANFDDRLLFLSECRKANVKIIPCEGPPVIDSDTGQFLEHAYTLGKKQSVLRAQISSRQGLHDRITLKHKPATFKPIYGYTWLKKELTLVPNNDLINVKLIIKLLTEGKTYDAIIKELEFSGIPSPSGLKKWNRTGIGYILNNPVYAGRYYGLKKSAIQPQKRKSKTYGNTSSKVKDLSEWEYLPEVKVLEPVLTWDQREKLLSQAKSRQWLSKRNAKNDYLLRGFVQCGEHTGVNGKPRIYHGKPYHDSYAYACPVHGCYRPLIPGPEVDNMVKNYISILVSDFKDIVINNNDIATKEKINTEIKELTNKANNIANKQALLEDKFFNNGISPEVYQILKDKYAFELEGNTRLRNNLLDQINNLKEKQIALESIEAITMRYFELLQADNVKRLKLDWNTPFTPYEGLMTIQNWRELFFAFNLEVRVNNQEQRKEAIRNLFISADNYDEDLEKRLIEKTKFDWRFDINIKTGVELNQGLIASKLDTIVSGKPRLGLHNKHIYPIALNLVQG